MRKTSVVKLCLSVFFLGLFCGPGHAQTTAFTYQGKLTDGANPANGPYHLQFKLYDTQSVDSGTQISSTLFFDGEQGHQPAVVVTNGVFTVQLDFGANAFPGAARFLEIGVKHPADGSYTPLNPRQQITAMPYAVRSLNSVTADIATNSTQLGGVAAANYVQTNDSRLSDARNPLPNSGNYIQNTTSPQAMSNFNINGNGTADGTLSGNVINATTQYNLNGVRILTSLNGSLSAGVNAGTTGTYNSFFGLAAGLGNTTGTNNSFFGQATGLLNTTGTFNTIVGAEAGVGSNNLTNATAIGARARVTQSNSLVLGSIKGVNNAATNTNVGIGTTAPTSVLHIVGSQPAAVSSGGGTNAIPALQVIGGKGGDTTDVNAVAGGNGGDVIAQAGDGGSGGIVGSFGGLIRLQAGAAGGGGPTAGYGGSITLRAGAGNPGNGGSIFLEAGPGSSAPGSILLNTNNAERMRITGDGKVGIGTIGPDYRLDVVGRSRFRQNDGAGNTGGTNSAGFWLFQNGPPAGERDRAFVGMKDDNNVGLYGINGGWGLVMNTGTGNVGIGTDPSSTAKLKVDGGDAAITKQGNGIILRAIDGPLCFRLTVNNVGALGTTSVPCP